ncbi:hypothetical protein N8D74_04455 [Curtobacterium flaccumfaciens]|uniref:Uncharacterized protein n=1 Tax=Curtobacterium poinsettiae TaxID=159612 RepID=A0A9Q9P9I1_9MICO|nr:hypothetical protein [Curtobacterium flaccumfaciens]UXN26139.1 hypothetical protein N8D74_04455 [Curtobacterium flaccumfaciens]UYC80981.1 hypothetical protein OE229_00535 [Curtobacterium flaccumfaciens pv. poinsettiae]
MEDQGQLAYSIQAIRRGELVAKYPGRKKALILREEGERWLQSLPDEPRRL